MTTRFLELEAQNLPQIVGTFRTEEASSQAHWNIVIIEEYHALMRNKTWSLVEFLANRKAIGCKMGV